MALCYLVAVYYSVSSITNHFTCAAVIIRQCAAHLTCPSIFIHYPEIPRAARISTCRDTRFRSSRRHQFPIGVNIPRRRPRAVRDRQTSRAYALVWRERRETTMLNPEKPARRVAQSWYVATCSVHIRGLQRSEHEGRSEPGTKMDVIHVANISVAEPTFWSTREQYRRMTGGLYPRSPIKHPVSLNDGEPV